MKKVHRYAKIKNALNAIAKFKPESESLYKWKSFGIFRRVLARELEECPGFIDMDILQCCDSILNEDPTTSMSKIKELAKKALEEISWEERSGNDLYPCIEID